MVLHASRAHPPRVPAARCTNTEPARTPPPFQATWTIWWCQLTRLSSWTASRLRITRCYPAFTRTCPTPTHIYLGNVDNLVVSADPSDLLDRLAAWEPSEKGLLLSAELRTAALGSDVNKHEGA